MLSIDEDHLFHLSCRISFIRWWFITIAVAWQSLFVRPMFSCTCLHPQRWRLGLGLSVLSITVLFHVFRSILPLLLPPYRFYLALSRSRLDPTRFEVSVCMLVCLCPCLYAIGIGNAFPEWEEVEMFQLQLLGLQFLPRVLPLWLRNFIFCSSSVADTTNLS